MNRSRLLLLVTSALLSTSVAPFDMSGGDISGGDTSGANAGDRGAASFGAEFGADHGALPAVSAPPRGRIESVSFSGPMANSLDQQIVDRADAEIAEQISRRLSIRHTGLGERERSELAYVILREARAHDLDPDLVIAVIEVESAGYHLAVSHVGAMGLMQLMPATGEELARKHDVDWQGKDTLFDPSINIKLGTAYLRQLTNRYGDVSVALAAYNWGPGAIDRRLRRGSGVPSDYIEAVMRAYDRNADRNALLASSRS